MQLKHSYTKHYYAVTQRITVAIGSSPNIGMFNCDWLISPYKTGSTPIDEKNEAVEKAQKVKNHSNAILQKLGIKMP